MGLVKYSPHPPQSSCPVTFRYRKWIKSSLEEINKRKYGHLKDFIRNITVKFESMGEVHDDSGSSGLSFVMCDTYAMLVTLFPSLITKV